MSSISFFEEKVSFLTLSAKIFKKSEQQFWMFYLVDDEALMILYITYSMASLGADLSIMAAYSDYKFCGMGLSKYCSTKGANIFKVDIVDN